MKQQGFQQASEEGLSATQGQILAALVSHGALSGKELSERLGVTLPTISESWLKSCLLQITLWSHPYIKDGDF